ncbi:MAG: outer membrane protein assembly factor BamA [bacterium]
MLSGLNKILTVFIFFFLFASLLFSQTIEKTYTILSINVEGNIRTDKGTIIAISGLREGDKLTFPGDGQNKLQSAIKNIWQRKQFADVKIEIEKNTPMGIFLLIKVKEFPNLSGVNVTNNKELSEAEIKKEIGKNEGDILSNYDVYLASQRLKKLYKKEGLVFAKVNTELETKDSNYTDLNIDVDEGFEYHVNQIYFQGNQAFNNKELEDAFEDTHTKKWWQFWRSSKLNLDEYEKDKEKLITFFKKKGYVDAAIIKDTLIYSENNDEVKIKIEVFEGERLFIRDIKFDGNTVYPDFELVKRLDFAKGDPYDYEKFEMNLFQNMDQTDVTSLYADNGYLAARLIPEEKRFTPDSVDIIVKVYENQRVKIRKVDIKGNTKTKDKVIRRELFTRPGEYFNRSAIIRSIRALGVMQYFNPEALKPDIKPVDDKNVDLIYSVEERSSDQINASIGFMGTFGLTGAVGLTLSNFSIARPFREGAGQILNLHAEFGQANRYQQYSIGFTEPWLFDEPTTVGFNLYYSWIRYNSNLNIRRTGGAINFGRRFHWPDDYFRGDWSVRLQENFVEGDGGYYYRTGLSTEFTLAQTISRTSFNNLFFPSVGSRFSFASSVALGALSLGNTDYFKNIMKFEMAHPLMQIQGNDRMVLYLSTNIGYITGFQSDTMINPIELYSMGGNGLSGFGVTPLRGYEDQSVGPYGGGKVLARHIAELRFAVSLDPMPVYFYGFAEAGNVWGDLKNSDPFNLKRSVGLGVQLMMMPIGVIGFSYGYGFDPVIDKGSPAGWKFLFHLGQQF